MESTVKKLNPRHALFVVPGTLVVLVLFVFSMKGESLYAGKIDAVRGKKYKITKRHGPWMIHVASFNQPPIERRGHKGLTPAQAADELVYELRKKGIPAYAFLQKKMTSQIQGADQNGRQRSKRFIAYSGGVSVLAGNYRGIDDKLAQKTLQYVKRFRPDLLSHIKAKQMSAKSASVLNLSDQGGVFRSTPGKSGPLSGAHLTMNPLLTQEDVLKLKNDPLIKKLNSGSQFSILNNPGKYSLVVASFYGNARLPGAAKFRKDYKSIDDYRVTNALDKAAKEAWDLTRILRRKNIEAYVFHDHDKSVVTVGSFESAQDPRIRQVTRIYGAKYKKHAQTGRKVLIAEFVSIPEKLQPGQKPEKFWMFEVTPFLIPVPKVKR